MYWPELQDTSWRSHALSTFHGFVCLSCHFIFFIWLTALNRQYLVSPTPLVPLKLLLQLRFSHQLLINRSNALQVYGLLFNSHHNIRLEPKPDYFSRLCFGSHAHVGRTFTGSVLVRVTSNLLASHSCWSPWMLPPKCIFTFGQKHG